MAEAMQPLKVAAVLMGQGAVITPSLQKLRPQGQSFEGVGILQSLIQLVLLSAVQTSRVIVKRMEQLGYTLGNGKVCISSE